MKVYALETIRYFAPDKDAMFGRKEHTIHEGEQLNVEVENLPIVSQGKHGQHSSFAALVVTHERISLVVEHIYLSHSPTSFPCLDTGEARLAYCSGACRALSISKHRDAEIINAPCSEWGPETLCDECSGKLPWPEPILSRECSIQ